MTKVVYNVFGLSQLCRTYVSKIAKTQIIPLNALKYWLGEELYLFVLILMPAYFSLIVSPNKLADQNVSTLVHFSALKN